MYRGEVSTHNSDAYAIPGIRHRGTGEHPKPRPHPAYRGPEVRDLPRRKHRFCAAYPRAAHLPPEVRSLEDAHRQRMTRGHRVCCALAGLPARAERAPLLNRRPMPGRRTGRVLAGVLPVGQPDQATVFTMSHGTLLTPQVTYQRQSHGTQGKETLATPWDAEETASQQPPRDARRLGPGGPRPGQSWRRVPRDFSPKATRRESRPVGQPDNATVFTLSHGTLLTPQVTYQRQSHGTLAGWALEAPAPSRLGGASHGTFHPRRHDVRVVPWDNPTARQSSRCPMGPS